MFKITNISNNPLVLQTGRVAPGATVSVTSVTDRERGFEARGWLRILKEKEVEPAKEPEPPKEPAKTPEPPKETAKAGESKPQQEEKTTK